MAPTIKEQMAQMMAGLKDNTATHLDVDFKILTIYTPQFHDIFGKKFFPELGHNTSLISLTIQNFRASEEYWPILRLLCKALQTNTSLTQLRFDNMESGGIDAIVTVFSSEPTALRRLSLCKSNITDLADYRTLENMLRANHTITSLDLSGSTIGLSGICKIVTALQHNTTLAQLSLASLLMPIPPDNRPATTLEAKTVKAIADAIKNNKTLAKLDLSGNNIDSVGIKELESALVENHSLLQLEMDNPSPRICELIARNRKEFQQKYPLHASMSLPFLDDTAAAAAKGTIMSNIGKLLETHNPSEVDAQGRTVRQWAQIMEIDGADSDYGWISTLLDCHQCYFVSTFVISSAKFSLAEYYESLSKLLKLYQKVEEHVASLPNEQKNFAQKIMELAGLFVPSQESLALEKKLESVNLDIIKCDRDFQNALQHKVMQVMLFSYADELAKETRYGTTEQIKIELITLLAGKYWNIENTEETRKILASSDSAEKAKYTQAKQQAEKMITEARAKIFGTGKSSFCLADYSTAASAAAPSAARAAPTSYSGLFSGQRNESLSRLLDNFKLEPF
jgi:hypothetical protein